MSDMLKAKRDLRKRIKEEMETMTVDRNHGELFLEGLLALEAYREAGTVFCYLSLKKEPDTGPIVEDILARGKKLCVPRCLKHGIMEACEINGTENLIQGSFQIPEPPPGSPVVIMEDIDLAIVPCMAVNEEGYRLGKGGGYYDRYMRGSRMTKVVLCWERFSHDNFLAEDHDVRMDYVITEGYGRKISWE